LLLIKRDFQNEYEKLSQECHKINKISEQNLKEKNEYNETEEDYLKSKKFYLFHQVYSLFLLCIDDLEALIELNDSLLTSQQLSIARNKFHSKLLEFYLSILNYLFFDTKITKFMYKCKLFAIVKCIAFTKRTQNRSDFYLNKSLLRFIQISFIRFKLHSSNLFCNQLIENNDIDLMMKQLANCLSPSQYAQQLSCSTIWSSLIYVQMHKLEQILRLNFNESQTTDSDLVMPANLGVHFEIRRLFEEALSSNSKSLGLWLLYFKFETTYGAQTLGVTSPSQNRMLSIY
jgi:hypothetical protein